MTWNSMVRPIWNTFMGGKQKELLILSMINFSEAMSQGNRISLFVLPNFAEVIRKTTPENKRLTLVDIGSGPTIYSALCFRNVVSKVYLADYLESNLSLLIEWLENRQNFDWIPVIRRVAKNEGCITTPDLIAKIEEETRRVVKNGSILHANVHNAEVLGANQNINSSQQFDILVSIFCLESACSTLTEYKNALKNMVIDFSLLIIDLLDQIVETWWNYYSGKRCRNGKLHLGSNQK
jgi:hypothetical protein